MPIAIGQKLESDFRNPLGLLSDCHRRIERFLDGLIAISEEAQGNKLDDLQRQQFEVGLRYFREAASKHTLDEEDSLFPRLRTRQDSESVAALALLDSLHADHAEAEIRHRRVDELGCKWLTEEKLPLDNVRRLLNLLNGLRTTYERHIGVEDNELFPFAGRILDGAELEAIAREMAARRGLVFSAGASE
jgi:hemerythrin-like domain-containing protein